MPEPILTAQQVNLVYFDSLAQPRKHGVTRLNIKVGKTKAVFDHAKLVEHFPTVLRMLAELPPQFFPKNKGGGGGWDISNACLTKDGVQWTARAVEVERLLALGMAQGWVKFLAPQGFPLVKNDYYGVTLPIP